VNELDNPFDLRVETAAVRTDDGVIHTLPRPARHWHVMKACEAKGCGYIRQDMQGFVLNNGRFATRRAALSVAIRAGQLLPTAGNPHQLLSEHVW
jgi:hypothetical protein